MSMYRSFMPARAKRNNDFDDLLDCLFWLFMDEADVVEIEGGRYIEESQVYELISKFKADMNREEVEG